MPTNAPANLSAKQAGYLRQIPASTADPEFKLATETKKMANKLVRQGLVDVEQYGPKTNAYRRTRDGDAALDAFDDKMRDQHAATLSALWRGENVRGDCRGLPTLVDAGLVHIPEDGEKLRIELTDAGKDLAETADADMALR